MNTSSRRRAHVLAGLLVLAGSVAFVWGGAQHPPTRENFGPIGSDAYFRAFAHHVLRHPGWAEIHTGILAGPVLWALGIAAAGRLRRRAPLSGALIPVALASGAALWAVTFVFDGFVAPVHARAVAAGTEGALAAFRANQEVVIRIGLAAWLLIGVGIAGVGAELLARSSLSPAVRTAAGGGGVALGLWPIAAWATGVFRPGPFTSGAWVATALLTALWFVALGGLLVAGRLGRRRRATPSGEAGSVAAPERPAYTRR